MENGNRGKAGGLRRLRRYTGRVNEVLKETEFSLPLIEFGGYEGGSAVVPIISLSTCEHDEKERIMHIP